MKRTQIYVDEDQDRRLARRAHQLGVTKSELIRTAVDELLAGEELRLSTFRDAVGATAGAVRSLSDGATYVESLRSRDTERLQALDGG